MREPFSDVRPDDHALWSCEDDQSSEDEVVGLLGSLVFALKPRVAVECGTWTGASTHSMGSALAMAGRGHLYAYEVDPVRAADARARCRDLPVTVHAEDAENPGHVPREDVDFLFIDGDLDNRLRIFMSWKDALAPGAYVAVHDSLKYWQIGEQVDEMERWSAGRVDLLTPRGLTIMRML